ncbi:sigma-70 family RNA polymerase sigma factor [Luteitalea sp.]|uniref:sigma-70 family RNA polymerase sigma factor n=1 Tax=Luteitalea sp. TaxID=2004800 RepID=UPI0025BE81AF|nr:sigma-70 family RNA polymerase sigma factor [Luteitalea sp.]
MPDLHTLGLIDSNGQPFDGRIARVLQKIAPRLRREFPALEDDVVVTEVLEEAGRRIVRQETKAGPLEKLHGFAWVTIRNVAKSRLKTGREQITRLEARGDVFTLPLAAQEGSPEQIERVLLLKEALASLSEDERQICLFKTLGYSTDEIARQQQRTPGAVDTMFCRAKQKLRDMLARPASSAPSSQAPSATRTASASSHPPLLPGPSDGPAPSLSGRRRVWG